MNRNSKALCAAMIIALLFGASSAFAFQSSDLPVYSNSLGAGWQNWSWSSTVNFNNSSPAVGGSGSSVAVTYTAAWAGLYLHNDSAATSSNYSTLRFSIHGGTAGAHSVSVYAVNAAGTSGPSIAVSPIQPGAWSTINISIASLGVSNIAGLVWQESGGASQTAFYLDDITLISSGTPPPALSVSIDATANRHQINPLIYGMNFADVALAADLRLPVRRWGGNATTRYNYLLDTSNRASDWFFENIPNANSNPGALPNGSASDQFIDQDRSTGTQSIMTLPLIGWTPKARQMNWGFSVAAYGAQQQVDPWQSDAGNGVRTNGTLITNNNPLDTSIAIAPAFVQGWISHLISRYGTASAGGVRFYNLDNEPMLWNSTHRDVHPSPTSYDEIRDRTWQYAAAVKATDPSCKTLGPVLWGWTAYFYSALDAAPGGSWWNNPLDRLAHGNTPFVEWYLQQMRNYEQSHGVRILDYLDLHFYPQAAGVALSGAGDAATQARRLRSTRGLWDASYVDESWIAEPVRLIPRMRDWVNAHYPGTKTAITEYNWGALDHINGALAQGDVLGIFGRERLDLATLWDPPTSTQPGAFAFRMYRNYDGAGRRFGETSVGAASADQGRVSIYAARRLDGALTVMLINKDLVPLTVPLSLTHFTVLGSAKVYRYSAADLTQIVQLADVPLPGGAASLNLPASSLSLLVIPGPACFDPTGDGVVNIDDLVTVITNWGTTSLPGNLGPSPGDVHPIGGNGSVNIDDLVAVITGWGACP